VRSVVRDSGSLPGVRVYDVSARNAERALDLQLARCGRIAPCRRAYPRSRRQLEELLARGPRRVSLQFGTIVLRPDDIAWTVDSLSETANGAATIPYAIDAAAHGDYTPLGDAYVEDLGPDLDPRSRLATFWVILCSEPWASFDPSATARDGAGSYLAAAAVARARLFRRACMVVPRGRVPADSGSVEVARALRSGAAAPPAPIRSEPQAGAAAPGPARARREPGTVRSPRLRPGLVARFIAEASRRLEASCRHVRVPRVRGR
jgi:hypothetical protein